MTILVGMTSTAAPAIIPSTANWQKISDGLPSLTELGPSPRCLVIRQCNQPAPAPPLQDMVFAMLVFLGKDPKRPIWCDVITQLPIENGGYFVSHWARRPSFPAVV